MKPSAQWVVRACGAALVWSGLSTAGIGQELFSSLTGELKVGAVRASASQEIEVPFITWGGDVATFLANGGLTTQTGSIFAQQNLKVKLVPGDDFVGQVKRYVSGQTPWLRGTFSMLAQASEVLGSDPRTKPVVVLQLSWSAGDHMIAREQIKTLNDLAGSAGKKVRIACQQGGPHVGLLYDALEAANIARDQVEIVWVKDLTGPEGPAERFRKDASIDACCVITPDMIGLTGGLESRGSGAEGTVSGAHVVVSTQQMSRSIADVYAVRADWFAANRPWVEKFVAGYLQGVQKTVALRRDFEEKKRLSAEYRQLLAMAQKIFGSTVITSLEVDGHGLLLDCNFVGLPGQIAFFEDRGYLNGFEAKMKSGLDMAVGWGYARSRSGFDPPGFDYQKLASIGKIPYERPANVERFGAEGDGIFPDSELEGNTIVSFTVSFEPNQSTFSADRYGAEFRRAIQQASTFGNAAVVIRGHADPTKTLVDMIRAGMEKGIVRRTGREGDYTYYAQGKQLDLTQTAAMIQLINTGVFEGSNPDPRQTVQAAQNLSLSRAEAVKKSLVEYARQQNLTLDVSQIKPTGAGISEPIVPKPTTMEEARANMRVEFRIVRVKAEALNQGDFNF
jgi:outer membrane protein OmpA-like peptidoglycan-associated protein/ABC-type nitrate/sulfonate/bicarbonate transport system substrate-binding protein